MKKSNSEEKFKNLPFINFHRFNIFNYLKINIIKIIELLFSI
jgi:hypothetical protein